MSMFDRMMLSACEDWVCGRFRARGQRHGCAHIGRQIRGGLGDQFQKAAREEFHTDISGTFILSKFGSGQSVRDLLLVPQGFNRTHARGLDGRQQSSDQPYELQQQRRSHHCELRNLQVNVAGAAGVFEQAARAAEASAASP